MPIRDYPGVTPTPAGRRPLHRKDGRQPAERAQVLPVAITTWVTNAATIRTPQMTAAMIKRLVLTPRQVSQRSVRQLNLDGG